MVLTIAAIAGITACSDEPGVDIASPACTEGLPVAALLQSRATASPAPVLDYSVYVFSRLQAAPTEAYRLDTLISPIETDSKLKFSNNQLSQKDYRFLFTATPQGTRETVVVTPSVATPSSGTAWEDIRLISGEPLLSLDNYYEVKDLSGKDILVTDTIRGRLSRIVGQMVFDFFKTDPSTKDPIHIDAGFTSIFDRIDTIQITYTNATTQLSFDAEGQPVPAVTNPQTVTQKIQFRLDNNFGTPIPQAQTDTLPGGVQAGGRLKGFCFLPATEVLKTVLLFQYYDTTPTSTDPVHQSDPAYYARRTLQLSVPASGGLPIQANTYTVNKAGIYCNRIIDIGVTGGFSLNLDWDIN